MSASLETALAAELQALSEAGTLKRPGVLVTPQGPRTSLAGVGPVLVGCSNDYLGLAAHPAVVDAGIEGLRRYGAGTASVRFICGTFEAHLLLERDLADFVGTSSALTFVSCWDANAALLTTLADRDTVIFSDTLNHASIVDACRTARSRATVVYPHGDVKALDRVLGEHTGASRRIVVTDGVFSMEGDLAPLPGLVEVTRRHDAILVVDDSHGLGVMGPTGRGTAEHFGLHGAIDVVTGTLGKSLGGAAGGFVASSEAVCAILAQRARPSLFSNALPPTVACSARAALGVLHGEPQRVARLHEWARRLRSGLTEAGLHPLAGPSAIVPVIVGQTAEAVRMSRALLDDYGVLVSGFGHPVVPEGGARLRLQANAAFEAEDCDAIVKAVTSVAG